MNNLKFSVLMSLYIKEKAEYFDACMQSILHQTVKPDEIVIVLDGPISELLQEVLDYYRNKLPQLIKIISYPENKGLGYALSVGVGACSNGLIARMDTDDIARKDRFEKQIAMFREHPELDICGSQIDEFENGPSNIIARRSVPCTDAEIKKYQKRRDAFNHMTVMYKRSSVISAGNYLPCPLMEDTYLWVRMIQNGAVCANIDEALVYARIGEDMYERRGTWSYFRKYKEGRKMVRDTGYISAMDYYVPLAAQAIVAIVPNGLRGWIFKHILHRK